MVIMIVVFAAAAIALGYAMFNYKSVKGMEEGNARMSEIAAAIREGANAFINYEYRIIFIVAAIVAVVFGVIFSLEEGTLRWEPSAAFILGTSMSALAGYIGMKIATYANVRVSNTARLTLRIGSTLKIALKGGSVMGLCVGGFALLGLFLVYVIFGFGMGYLNMETIETTGSIFTQCLSCYALGCSIVAMFNRVGGGI